MSLTGQVIDGKYRITNLIGRGGMGDVYEGENVRIKRKVAIKVLHAASAASAEIVSRFEREAQAAGCIGSDHILEVLDLGSLPSGDRYMVMEFLEGETLTARITRSGRMTAAQLAPIMRQVLAGLGAAHDAGIIHRDLKPDNLFILRQKAGNYDYLKIIDFGISKFSRSPEALNMTRAGAMMGTPLYMSPEQANGSSEADARSDLYSLGVIMYEALTGMLPFNARTFNELLFQIVLAELQPISTVAPDVEPEFATIVTKAMARVPADRFQNAREFIIALEGWMKRHGVALTGGQALTQSVPPTAGIAPRATQLAYQSPAGAPSVPGHAPQVQGLTPMPAGAMPSQQQATAGSGLAQSTSDSVAFPAKKSNTPIIVVAVALLVVVGGGGIFAATRIFGGGDGGADDSKKSAASKDESKDDESKSSKSEAGKKNHDQKTDDSEDGTGDKPGKKPGKKTDQDDDTQALDEAPTAKASSSVAPLAPTSSASTMATAIPTATTIATVGGPKTPLGKGKPDAGPGKVKPGGETDFGY